jgi:hypothetical protein
VIDWGAAQLFEANEAQFITAAKGVQIDYFIRQELIAPARPASRRGVSRAYNAQNLIEIAVAVELLESGIPATEIAAALTKVRERWGDLSDNEKMNRDEYVLTIYRYALSAPAATSAAPSVSVDIGPIRLLSRMAETLVLRANLPLRTIFRNIESRILALNAWKASRP